MEPCFAWILCGLLDLNVSCHVGLDLPVIGMSALGRSLVRSLIHLLICLLCTAGFSRALCCTHSLALLHSLTRSAALTHSLCCTHSLALLHSLTRSAALTPESVGRCNFKSQFLAVLNHSACVREVTKLATLPFLYSFPGFQLCVCAYVCMCVTACIGMNLGRDGVAC